MRHILEEESSVKHEVLVVNSTIYKEHLWTTTQSTVLS